MSKSPENIILLTIDALRSDHLSYKGYDKKTTPNLDRIAKNNTVVSNAISASSHTREAIPALLTGKTPSNAIDGSYRLNSKNIATYLGNQDFRTGAFHSNPYISRAYGFDEGFEEFDDDLRLGGNRLVALAQRAIDKLRNRHYASADEINSRSMEWIDSIKEFENFFVWNHYMDVHGPYNPPGEFGEVTVSDKKAQNLYQKCVKNPNEITEDEKNLLIDLYDGEIRYVDKYLGKFVSALKKRSLLDESLLVITSDHGDAFGEHGYYGHPRYLHNELLKIPLIIIRPENSSQVLNFPVSTLDIVVTIIEEVGMDGSHLPGKNIFHAQEKEMTNRIVYSSVRGENEDSHIHRFCAQTNKYKYTIEKNISTGEVTKENALDLQDKRSIKSVSEGGEELIDIKKSLETHISNMNTSIGEPSDNDEEAVSEIQDRLEALGYK